MAHTVAATSCSDSSKSGESTTDSGNAPRPAPPQVGDKAGDFMLTTLDRKPVQLSKQLAHGPVVLVVLRGWPGYQCPICTRQVGQLHCPGRRSQDHWGPILPYR